MKKSFTLIAFLMLLCQMVFAGPIDQAQALKLAENFFGAGATRAQLKMTYKASAITRAGQAEENLFYIINRGNDQGYVVIAADNRVKTVLAFSDKGTLTEQDIQNHPSIKWMYDEYRNQIKWAIENQPDIPSNEYKMAATTRARNYQIEIQPLLEYATDRTTKLATPISWGQSWPFNQYSPNYRYNGNSYPTVSGCVATGICPVLRWHKWPRKATGSVSYYWKGKYMALNFDGNGSENAAYDWSQMPAGVDGAGRDRLTGRRVTDVQADNIGRLLRDIGYAVEMDYNPAAAGGSGAFVYKAPRVLTRNFGYKNTVRFLERDNYYDNAWLKEIHDEMRDYGPVVYAGYSNGGGHCFVLDGFASNGYVHVDWGWNYSSNGWHLLNVLRPGQEGIGGGAGGYSSNQQMLRYLKPDRDFDPEPDPNPNPDPKPDPNPDEETEISLYIAAKCAQTTLEQRNSVPITITVGNSNSEESYYGRLALAIFKNSDSKATIIGTTTASIGADAKKAITFYANLANIDPGTYNLSVNYAYGSGYKPINDIAGTVTVGKTKPNPEPDPDVTTAKPELVAVQKVISYITKGENAKIVATLANEGKASYNGQLRLYALPITSTNLSSATVICEGNAKVEKSQRVTFSFYTNDNLKTLNTGKYNLIIGYFVDNKEIAVKASSGTLAWKIGELTINPENNNNKVTKDDVKLQTIYFYQSGSYLGTDNAYISRSSGKFTARVYVKTTKGFEGRVCFYVTDMPNGSKAVNSYMQDKRTVSMKPNTNGYIDVVMPTTYLRNSRYYMNIMYTTSGNNWMYYPTDAVPFYTYASYSLSADMSEWDKNPTMGPTFDFKTAPAFGQLYQSVGNKADGNAIDNTLGIGEVKANEAELTLYANVVTSEITISAQEAGVLNLFSVSGNLICKYDVKAGDNVIDVTNLPAGVYLISKGKTTLKFVKK